MEAVHRLSTPLVLAIAPAMIAPLPRPDDTSSQSSPLTRNRKSKSFGAKEVSEDSYRFVGHFNDPCFHEPHFRGAFQENGITIFRLTSN